MNPFFFFLCGGGGGGWLGVTRMFFHSNKIICSCTKFTSSVLQAIQCAAQSKGELLIYS